MAALNCNNCTRYVENQKVSLYYGAYDSKHSGENEKALAEVIRSLNSYEAKIIEQRRQIEEQNATKFESTDSAPIRPIRTDSSIGMGKLLAAARASTNGETVGAHWPRLLREEIPFSQCHMKLRRYRYPKH